MFSIPVVSEHRHSFASWSVKNLNEYDQIKVYKNPEQKYRAAASWTYLEGGERAWG